MQLILPEAADRPKHIYGHVVVMKICCRFVIFGPGKFRKSPWIWFGWWRTNPVIRPMRFWKQVLWFSTRFFRGFWYFRCFRRFWLKCTINTCSMVLSSTVDMILCVLFFSPERVWHNWGWFGRTISELDKCHHKRRTVSLSKFMHIWC